MGQGGQSRGLIIASRTQGWDPTKIEGGDSIANFDKDPKLDGGAGTGKLTDTVPGPVGSIGFEQKDWNVGLGGKPQPDRKTRGADPTPGMPGA